jgi:predicted permease
MRDDLKTAIRSLRKSPATTVVALVVLALGIGAGTAIFSVVDAVVLRGLPFDEHDRIVAVLEHDTTRPTTFGGGQTTAQMYLDWRRLQDAFEGVALVSNWMFRQRSETGETTEIRAQRVTPEFFPTLRAAPLLGRAFTADDELEGRHRVVILSHGFWQRRYGGSPNVVGRTIGLSTFGTDTAESYEIVGVMPRGFAYPVAAEQPTELYAPVVFEAEDRVRAGNRNYNYTAIARLKDGVGIEQANNRMNRLMAALDQEHPTWSPGWRARVITLHGHIVGRVRSWMLMLLGAVVLVLFIACANVANLMLARATVRGREIGIRAALGASRWRLVRGLLVEGLVLSLAGAAIGVLLAYAGVQILRMWLPAGLPRVAAVATDLRVLGFAVGAAVFTGVFFGIVPALQSSRPDLTTALKDSGRGSTAGAGSQALRSLLVVAEVSLAVVLLVGAGLFTGSFIKLMRVDPGFDYHNVLTLNVGLPSAAATPTESADERAQRRRVVMQQVLAAVSAVPGVRAAGAVSGGLPLTGSWSRTGVTLPGSGEVKGDDGSIDRRSVSPGYLELLRIPLRRGRYLTADDREGSPPVLVINEAAARKYWPARDALGQRITINSREWTVVGIVGDIRHLGPERPARQEAYIPMAQDRSVPSTLVARTAGDPATLLPAVKAAIATVSRDIRTSGDIVTLDGYMDRLIAQRRFNMALLALFGVLGLVIAAAGIYAVMAYVVAQRTNEIGVRMALGATPRNVVSLVLRRAAILLAAGLALGCAAAWSLGGLVGSFLFEIEPADVRIFVAALAVLAAAGLVASAVPARRAALVDPLIALRQE